MVVYLPVHKAYHSYMYYGVGIGEYARSHNLKRSTFHGWSERYPKGLPFYNADDPTQVAPDTPEGEVQMVNLSPSQLENPQVQVMQKTEYHESVSIAHGNLNLWEKVVDILNLQGNLKDAGN